MKNKKKDKKNKKRNENVIVYIDGFNLYFGIIEKGWNEYKWLNLKSLAKNLLKPDQKLIDVKYFTSRMRNNPGKEKRQKTYIEALETTRISITYGHYQSNIDECYRCGHTWSDPNEKMTDVNIATQMIIDAYQNKYDTAILISGDSDLVPPIKAIHNNFKNKRVVVVFPPERFNRSVALVAKGSYILGRKKLKDNQLPETVTKKDGYMLRRPKEWK